MEYIQNKNWKGEGRKTRTKTCPRSTLSITVVATHMTYQ